ncbi:MAG TPA: ZIP family metal transporter [Flavipsychrobacter sp.]|nr:ZIP family metal transporter [Flavipsychrobacter sp.]
MHLIYNLLLFVITFVGGLAGLRMKVTERSINYLLAFSGSFLLSITLLHLLPETFEETGEHAGLYILCGFFLQLVIQRLTHGVEHGHVHTHAVDQHSHSHAVHFNSIFIGLSIHAFMEGLPLGFNYRAAGTEPSLYLAVAAHKLPEAILLSTLAMSVKSRRAAFVSVFIFSLFTPLGSVVASALGREYYAISKLVAIVIPVVAGVFIHIATTIFFESGTKHHMLTRNKIVAIVLGVGLGLATLLLE